MILRCILIFLCAAALILPASADPLKDESGYGYYSTKHYKSQYRNKYTKHRLPPWAAQASLNNPLDFERVDEPVEAEAPKVEFLLASKQIGIFSGKCKREAVTALMGGGVIDNRRDNTTVGGSLINVSLGKEIDRKMDNADAQCANEALERAEDGQPVRWDNPKTGHRYSIVPYQSFQKNDGRYCRKYRAAVNSGSNTKYFGETACRKDDGKWERFPSS